ncbi:PRTase-like protein [Multifurca ochricompacta]|uniref:PRTase-like protein n=1 Tax=Multifurca ochricompacta TaxID=376703 RepID=A0AAD4M9R0_9AGAM|nr:PRTase-like protein [Multifurca ochricompacta]
MAIEPEHFRITYNEVHNIIKHSAKDIAEFNPDIMIAIANILEATQHAQKCAHLCNGLSLYEEVPGLAAEAIGSQVIRTQWLPEAGEILLRKRVLIVDEVDDSRKTLQYAVSELRKDVEKAIQLLPEHERDDAKSQFAVFVVHNKLKTKLGSIPSDIPYYAGEDVEDIWLDYPWEARDIEEHDRLALAQKKV